MTRKIKKVVHTLLIALAIVAFWRGVWGLMDIYLFPNNAIVSFSVSLVIGILILSVTEKLTEHLI